MGKGGALLGTQHFGAIQHLCDAALLRDTGKGELVPQEILPCEMFDCGAGVVVRQSSALIVRSKLMYEKSIEQAWSGTYPMDRFLEFHVWRAAIPYGSPSRLPAFANQDVASPQAVALKLMIFKAHGPQIGGINVKPTYIRVSEVRKRSAFILLCVEHLAETQICDVTKSDGSPTSGAVSGSAIVT
jgi:hypothetical protein